MMKLRCLLAVSVVLVAWEHAAAQTMLDIIPKEAAVAVSIRNLNELVDKGDKFLTDTDIKVPFRPSQLFQIANQVLGIRDGLDAKKPAAILLMSPEKGEKYRNFEAELLVPVIPFSNADLMAGNFGIKKGMLIPKKIVRTDRPKMNGFIDEITDHAMGTQDHLYLSSSKTTLERILKSTSIAAPLSPGQRKQLNESDILIHFGRHLWAIEAGDFPGDLARRIAPGDDPAEQEFARQFTESLKELQQALLAFRLEGGIDGHFVANVPRGGAAAKLLASLSQNRKPSTLAGLPEGTVLLAQASSGDSAQHALLVKSLFSLMLEDLLVRERLIAKVDLMNYLGVFHEVWTRLAGNRLAVYQNSDEPKHGLFSAIAILDAEDPRGFLQAMRLLARMAVADSLDWTKKEVKEEIDIAKVVKDLGSSVYGVRHSAATKLMLIGEPALPYLQKAIDSKELALEALRRSQDLRQRISDVAAARRKELLADKKNLFLRPKLTFVSAAEKRLGESIDVIQVAIPGIGKADRVQYVQLFGPDWDKIRVGIVGKHLVVMLGSDTALFETALRNLKMSQGGLETSKRLAAFRERSTKERLFEFHVSIEGIMRLVTQQADVGRPVQLTSASLSLGETSLQVDAHVPTQEVRTIAKKAQEQFR